MKRLPDRAFFRPGGLAAIVAAAAVFAAGAQAPQEVAIDLVRSTVTVHIAKAGALSAFGHEHVVSAPIATARLKIGPAPELEVVFETRSLAVLDPDLSASDRLRIHETMESAEVLDPAHYPEIVFRATDVRPLGEGRWAIAGTLNLHGHSRPLRLEVAVRDGRYRGSAALAQRDFGIAPVRFGGGLVRVRDAVIVDFDIALEGA